MTATATTATATLLSQWEQSGNADLIAAAAQLRAALKEDLRDVLNATQTWERVWGPVGTLLQEPTKILTSPRGESMVKLPTAQTSRTSGVFSSSTPGTVHQHDAWAYQSALRAALHLLEPL